MWYKGSIIAMLCWVSSVSSFELSEASKVYAANDGIRVVIAPIQGENKALLQMTGIHHPVNGVVFMSDIVNRDGSVKAYQFQRDGKTRAMVLQRQGWNGDFYEAFVPDGPKVSLRFDPDANERLSLTVLKDTYLQQQAEGRQAELAKLDRTSRIEHANRLLQRSTAEVQQHCGSSLTTSIDWNSIDDTLLADISAGGFCAVVASELAGLCRSDERYRAIAKTFNEVSCQFTDRLQLTQSEQVLEFRTNRSEPNQQEFVRSFFRNQ